MNGPLESSITTVVSVAIGGALVHLCGNMISEPDRITLTQALTTIAVAAGGTAVGWWKARQRTQAAMIKQIEPDIVVKTLDPKLLIRQINDADNGLKVVPEGATASAVDKPMRGPGS
jgi:hypothetical protein